jgi:hypothetical protein
MTILEIGISFPTAGASLFEHSWLSFLTQAAPLSLASDSAWHAFHTTKTFLKALHYIFRQE